VAHRVSRHARRFAGATVTRSILAVQPPTGEKHHSDYADNDVQHHGLDRSTPISGFL
jgi:hypothetical protein